MTTFCGQCTRGIEMPAPNLVVHPAQRQVAAEFWRQNSVDNLSISELSRRLEKRGLTKERSALSRILHCETAAEWTELEMMAAELGLRLTWKVAKHRAA